MNKRDKKGCRDDINTVCHVTHPHPDLTPTISVTGVWVDDGSPAESLRGRYIMDGLVGTGAVVLGLLVRFGLPVLGTGLLIWFLRKLDERWQREAAGVQSVESEESQIFSTLRCWIFNDCTPEQRERCPAFIEAMRPCWQVHRNGDGSMKSECIDCELFKQAPIPIPALS
jgi:hypothetical protein